MLFYNESRLAVRCLLIDRVLLRCFSLLASGLWIASFTEKCEMQRMYDPFNCVSGYRSALERAKSAAMV